MIVHKMWMVKGTGDHHYEKWWFEGWFFLGFIPLYIKTMKHEFPI